MSNHQYPIDLSISRDFEHINLSVAKDFEHMLQEFIKFEYLMRKKKWPDAKNGLLWTTTEVAEAIELLMQRDGDWTRNNPENKKEFTKARLERELGDIIWMALVVGIVEDVNPISGMISKALEKIDKSRILGD